MRTVELAGMWAVERADGSGEQACGRMGGGRADGAECGLCGRVGGSGERRARRPSGRTGGPGGRAPTATPLDKPVSRKQRTRQHHAVDVVFRSIVCQ